MKNPIIGITLDYENNGGYSKFPWYAIRENYLSCLHNFGAIPFPLFHQSSLNDHFLKTLDGLVIQVVILILTLLYIQKPQMVLEI